MHSFDSLPTVVGGNPILPVQYFIPDVEAHQWSDGRMYAYGSKDTSGQTSYCSNEYHVFSSADLVEWTDHGVSFTSADVSWADKQLFAPDCIYKDGLYYLYFCMAGNAEGVATSSSPHGPFSNAVPVEGADGDAIDPAAFVDDDGEVYYFWGQFKLRGARLKPSLNAIDPDTFNPSLLNEPEHGFHEGSSIRKRNGIYYMVYADTSRGKATSLGYATSRSPLGPFEKRGIIIDNDGCDPETWNNHGSIAEFNGKWYVFYHRSHHGTRFNRRVCVEPIEFNDDGTIAEVEMTTQGVCPPLPCTSRIQAWHACLLSGKVRTEMVEVGDVDAECLSMIYKDNWAAYKYIDFGAGITSFHANAASRMEGGTIEVRIDAPDGELIASCPVACTNGWHRWQVSSCEAKSVTGVHAVYLVFRGPRGRLFSLESFVFQA